MNLQPISSSKPAYPRRRRPATASWLRRLAVAAGASAALWLSAGCDGINPIRPPGDMAPVSYFTCSTEVPVTAAQIEIPGSYEGSLCGSGQAGWGRFEIQLNTPLRFTLDGYEGEVRAEILDEEGIVVDELSIGEPIELTLPPGIYDVAFRAGAEGYEWSYFTFTVEHAI